LRIAANLLRDAGHPKAEAISKIHANLADVEI
jgi:hypothetical protein